MEKKTTEMESNEGLYGFLLLYRKDGQPGTSFAFVNGKTTIGSSKDADIRLKINDVNLEEIHCIIDVNDNGIATLLNKSELAPVKVNGISVRKFRVLNHEDKIELVGKKFAYINENITNKDVEKHQTYLSQALLTPSKKRQSVAPIIRSMSSKKSPIFKTKTPILKRNLSRRSFAEELTVSHTPNNKPNGRSLTEAPKTTSKIIVSKALGSPCSPNKRRLSFGDNPKKFKESPRVSARNILISENIVSSTISEEDEVVSPKPSVSMKKGDKSSDFGGNFLDETNVSVEEIEEFLQSRRSTKNTHMKTPSTTSIKVVITEATPIQPVTPKPKTPVNKRLDSLRRTPLSLKKSPLYKSSPRISKIDKKTPKKSVNLINFEDSDADMEISGKKTPKTPALKKSMLNLSTNTPSVSKLSFKENNPVSSKKLDKSNVVQTPARISLRRNCSSIYRRDNNSTISSPLEKSKLAMPKYANESTPQGNFIPRNISWSIKQRLNTPRNISTPKISSSLAKNKLSSVDSSAEESVLLNLSSGSSVSPIKSLPRKSLASTDTEMGEKQESVVLEESEVRKSLRKNKSLLQSRQSSGVDVESSDDSFHLNLSDNESSNNSQNNLNLTERQSSSEEFAKKSRNSVRESHVEDGAGQELSNPTKQRVWAASRRSSRRADNSIIEPVDDTEQSAEKPDKSIRKSRQSLRHLRSIESTQPSNNFLSLNESSTSNAETSFDIESPNNSQNDVNLSEDQSSSKESAKKSRNSVRKGHVEDGEGQELTDPTKQRVSAASRRSSRRVDNSIIEPVEDTEQSAEEPDKFTRKSRQILKHNLRSVESNSTQHLNNSLSLNGSSTSNTETSFDIESPNNSQNDVNLTEDQFLSKDSAKKSRSSARKSHVEDGEGQELPDPTKQRVSTASRRSSRRADNSLIESVDTEQSAEESDKSTRKSRQSLRNNLRSVESDSTQHSNNSLSLNESSTSNAETYFDKSLAKPKRYELERGDESRKLDQSAAKRRSSLRTSEKLFEKKAEKVQDSPNLSIRVSRLDERKRSSVRKSTQINNDSEEVSSENLNISSKTPNSSIKSIERPSLRRSSRVNVDINDEDFVNVSLSKTSLESNSSITSLARRDSEMPKEARSSLRKSNRVSDVAEISIDDSFEEVRSVLRKSNRVSEIAEISTDGSFEDTSVSKTPKETPYQRRTMSRKSGGIRVSSSNEEVNYTFKSLSSVEEVNMPNAALEKSEYSSEDDSVFEEASEVEKSRRSIKKRKSSLKTPLVELRQNVSVITLDDSIDGTPENNTSVVIIDTPFQMSEKSHKKRSKIFRYSVDEHVELATPKSVIKRRRPKSLPYNPVTEDITPVTPLETSPCETGFKTPLNTPGLFENIKKSVLKSRSRSKKSSGLMEELNKLESVKKAVKRQRESSESSAYSSKRRKLGESRNDTENTFESFDSFETQDILTDISDQDISYDTPKYFSDLTDKPVINHPLTRGSTTDPRPTKQNAAPPRRSLQATRRSSRISSSGDLVSSNFTSDNSDVVSECNVDSSSSRKSSNLSIRQSSSSYQETEPPPKKNKKSPKNDLSDLAGLKKLLKTPEEIKTPTNDLTDIRGVRKLLQTPKTIASSKNDLTQVLDKSPTNDFRDVIGVKKLLSTPKVQNSPRNDLRHPPNLRNLMSLKTQNSPRNDLTNVAGVKKLLGTPKEVKSPKNDLTKVPNLRKLMSPKQQNSPRNDLTNVAGVKKLLGTPKEVKSPKNDLTKVPNLRKLMSPKQQNDPKNDLTNVAGVKKLLSTPKLQNSPKNDLTKVPNLRKMMSPKHQNSPKNDLTDVRGLKRLFKSPRQTKEPLNDLSDIEGVADIFNVSASQTYNESDAENNEELFDKLFSTKPLRTYRGRSVSPETIRNSLFGNKRKTLGDLPYTSPRVERWLSEQSNINYQSSNQEPSKETVEESKKVEKKTRGKKIIQEHADSPKKSPRGRRRRVIETEVKSKEDTEQIVEENNKKATRSRRKVEETVVEITAKIKESTEIKADNKKKINNETKVDESEFHSTSVEVDFKAPPKRRGRPRKDSQNDNKTSQLAEPDSTTQEIKSTPRRHSGGTADNKDEDTTDNEVSIERPRRGRKVGIETDEKAKPTEKKPMKGRVLARRGRNKQVADEEKKDSEADESANEEKTNTTRGKRRNIKLTESVDIAESKETSVHETANNARTKGTRGKRRNVENQESVDIDESKETPVQEMTNNARTKGTRGKRRNVENEESVDIDESKESASNARTKGTRGKRRNVENQESVDIDESKETSVQEAVNNARTKGTRGKRRNVENQESVDIDESKETSVQEMVNNARTKGTRGQRRNVENEESVDIEESNETSVQGTRGRQKNVKNEETDSMSINDSKIREQNVVASTSTRTARTRRLASNSDLDIVIPEEKSKLPKKTGRRNKNTAEDAPKMEETVPKSRRRKAVQMEENDDTAKSAEETQGTKKRTRGDLAEDELALIESPRSTRAKRGNFNRYGAEFLTEKNNEKVKHVRFEDTPEAGGDKRRKGRNVDKVEVEETNRRSKRTRK